MAVEGGYRPGADEFIGSSTAVAIFFFFLNFIQQNLYSIIKALSAIMHWSSGFMLFVVIISKYIKRVNLYFPLSLLFILT